MLLHDTPLDAAEERALLTVAQWGQRWTRTRTLVAIVAAMHLLGSFMLVAAPHSQLFTQGSQPAFDLFPPAVWALLFLAAGLGSASLLHRFTGPRQWAAWLLSIPTQAVWIGASALAVAAGRGSVLSLVFLPALLAFTLATALWVLWDFAAGRR